MTSGDNEGCARPALPHAAAPFAGSSPGDERWWISLTAAFRDLRRCLAERMRSAASDEKFHRRALLLLILLGLSFYKIAYTSSSSTTHVDGGYYTDIALHVRDGRGLVTNCSIMYKGYPEFPHPTAVYPLWPLVYGYVARAFPLLETGKWLATTFYYLTLLVGYLWGSRLFPRPLLPGLWRGFNAGHLLVLMFGIQHQFFRHTTLPYTEGLTYAITLVALWRGATLWARPTWYGGVEMGLWLGLGFLSRYQLAVLALAFFAVAAWAAVAVSGKRRKYAGMALCAAGAMALVVGPHYLYVRGFVPGLRLAVYMQWPNIRFTESLPAFKGVREFDSLGALLLDRLQGFEVAFDPTAKRSYSHVYYTFQYSAVAAVPLVAGLAVKHAAPRHLVAGWRWLTSAACLNWLFVVAFALAGFTSIHMLHMSRGLYPEWYFALRHSLTCMFFFYLCMVLLLWQRRAPWRMVGVCLLLSSIYLGALSIRGLTLQAERSRSRSRAPSALVEWLNAETVKRHGMVVAAYKPQLFAFRTPNVGYHWYYTGTTLRHVEVMAKELHIDYLLVPRSRNFAFTRSPEFARAFTRVRAVGGQDVYAPSGEAGKPRDRR